MAGLHTTLARIQSFYKQALVIELLVRPIRKHLPQSSVLIAQLRLIMMTQWACIEAATRLRHGVRSSRRTAFLAFVPRQYISLIVPRKLNRDVFAVRNNVFPRWRGRLIIRGSFSSNQTERKLLLVLNVRFRPSVRGHQCITYGLGGNKSIRSLLSSSFYGAVPLTTNLEAFRSGRREQIIKHILLT